MAQPALSRQVRRLEVDLRQALLVRNGRGATLTDAGRRLLEHARGIQYQVERAREDLDEMRGAPVGHAIIGVKGAPPGTALEALDWMRPVTLVVGEGATEAHLAAAFSSITFGASDQ